MGKIKEHDGTDLPHALMDDTEAARFLGMGRRTLQNWRVLGGGPPFLRLGRSIRYSLSDLQKYLDARRFRSTTEAGAVNGKLP